MPCIQPEKFTLPEFQGRAAEYYLGTLHPTPKTFFRLRDFQPDPSSNCEFIWIKPRFLNHV